MEEANVASVKDVLRAGRASEATVLELQSFFYPASSEFAKAATSAPGNVSRNAQGRSQRGTGQVKTNSRRAQPIAVRKGGPVGLSPRLRYALAADVVNIGLNFLADSSKRVNTANSRGGSSQKAMTASAPRISAPSSRALQPCSGNSTPVKSTSTKSNQATRASPSASDLANDAQSRIARTADCVQHAFAYLCATDPRSSGVRGLPLWQLESGLLSLAANMCAHGLDHMALKPLRQVKRRLEVQFAPLMPNKTKTAPTSERTSVERESLAILLALECSPICGTEALAVATTYQDRVIKILANHRTPEVIEEALRYLQIEAPNSPIGLIIRQAEDSGDSAKASKRLNQLSQVLFGMCPSISSDADQTAQDLTKIPSPRVVFEVQMLALNIRRRWWRMVRHESDESKEILEPFRKCTMALIRRCSISEDPQAVYESIARNFQSLSVGSDDSKRSFILRINIYDMLCFVAEQAHRYDEAEKWTKMMREACFSLEENHALRVLSMARELWLLIRHSSSNIDPQPTLKILAGVLSGHSSDFDLLVKAVADLANSLLEEKLRLDPRSVHELASVAATFALEYTRTYPSHNLPHVQEIVDSALRCCKTIDALLAWITPEAATVYLKTGLLKAIANDGATKALSVAWARSTKAVSCSRMLQALVLRGARSEAGSHTVLFIDDGALPLSERGVLLEWQLMYVLELANKPKYHDTLARLLPGLLRSLSKTYAEKTFPLRRARVTLAVFRLRESHPALVPPHLFQPWYSTQLDDGTDLADDVGLQGFYDDTRVSLTVARLFLDNRPCFKDLRPLLRIWEEICNDSDNATQIRQRIHEPKDLVRQLDSIAAYFQMLGEDRACLPIRLLLVRLAELLAGPSSTLCHAILDLARQYLELGYAEQAKIAIERAAAVFNDSPVSSLVKLDQDVASAECSVLTDKPERGRLSLEDARQQRSRCVDEKMSFNDKTRYGILHARAWLAQSTCSMEAGEPHNALAAARQSVKIVDKLWSDIEKPNDLCKGEAAIGGNDPVDCAVRKLTKGVSKLQLQPRPTATHSKAVDNAKQGARFWPFVSILCRALLHLSDMYAHHGIFHESNYYSEKSIRVAESVGSTALLSRVRSHRSRLLVLAGRREDAELCLAHDENTPTYEPSLALAERYCALATVRRQDNPQEAITLYERAETVLACIMTNDFIAKSALLEHEVDQLQTDSSIIAVERCLVWTARPNEYGAKTAAKSRRTATGKSREKEASQRSVPPPMSKSRTQPNVTANKDGCHVLQKMRLHILVCKALMQASLGLNTQWTLEQAVDSSLCTMRLFDHLLAQYQVLMQRITNVLENDVVLNVLRESTLCMPALRPTRPLAAAPSKRGGVAGSRTKAGVKSASKISKREPFAQDGFAGLLHAAKELLFKAHLTETQSYGMPDIHRLYAMLLKTGSLLSSVSKPNTISEYNSQTESVMIDLPRSRALQSERFAVSLSAPDAKSLKPSWPVNNDDRPPLANLSACDFQKDIVDILPRTWTAISLCLNEDASELYIARYDCDKMPLILRLPFSRHKPDGLEEEVFDFYKGKAELQEIIDLSNYSCHNSGNLDEKAIKTKWWRDRQALDRRLQELLVNVENIWFGGFRGVFAQFTEDADSFSRFRMAFDEILNRHLPSRQAAKRQTEALSLDSRVLELFIGLGHDRYGAVDLDEPLCDLLYFVVDMLQFGGEHNAYDEIDFDSMAVDILDALRSYHDDSSDSASTSRHLILVLDRRLQAFPWESLPCMEDLNVSRVGSMLSLRERILGQCCSQSKRPHERSDGADAIPASGTYILNPSSDLPRTQAMMEPTLSNLGSGWENIVAQEPDEARFTSAITNSSILLYFGHGPGTQYIRSATIRRQGTCCNVAWLMGCSSGAVTENGDLEPSAVPLAYLLAGTHQEDGSDMEKPHGLCRAVVATLWDVTDKDIDRFSLRLGEEWGLWPPSNASKLPTKTPRKREMLVAPSTPQQIPKTPKTPKVHRSPAPFKTPARDRQKPSKPSCQQTSLVEALSRSREACYLRYLNGAAPVVYGVPVYLET